MTAATASASAPSRLFSHRYSESAVSPPRLRESYHTQSLSPSSSSSNIRDTTTHTMPFSTPSFSTDTPSQLERIASPARRFSHADASAESANVKYACASCIRGHRTSSCNHKDGSKGPLYPIRSKGRPPTQCEICRKKRKESGRHVRCDCTGKKTTSTITPAKPDRKSAAVKSNVPILPRIDRADADHSDDSRPAKRSKTQIRATASAHRDDDVEQADHASSTSFAHDNILPPILAPQSPHPWSLPSIHSARSYQSRTSQSPPIQDSVPTRYSTLSLSSLMNPCGCRSTGSCTCCSEPRQRRAAASSPKQVDCGLEDGCDPSQCSCSGGSCGRRKHSVVVQNDKVAAESTSSAEKSASCCSGKSNSKAAAPSIELLLQAVDMSTEFVPPTCGCGEKCRCARCVAKQDSEHRLGSNGASSMTSSSPSPKTPPAVMEAAPGCDDCAACDLALERPSGIGAVDRWMEHQRESTPASDVNPNRAAGAGASSGVASVPTLHGGLLSDSSDGLSEVRAELVLVHPKCEACLEVVRSKGVGVLSR